MKARRRRPSPQDRRMVRKFLLLRDKNCRYCGGPAEEKDHVVPQCNKGDDTAFTNLVMSCKKCNATKGRESGFTMKRDRLYWHGCLVAPGSIFGAELMEEVEAQRRARQLAQGLGFLVDFKQRQERNSGGAS